MSAKPAQPVTIPDQDLSFLREHRQQFVAMGFEVHGSDQLNRDENGVVRRVTYTVSFKVPLGDS